ncbi:hypothetical protein F5887DRAFT_389951 [Amanita rubescens]|nr:hypothetical protein F5887DRAFT_389951 [Amanita rubescens]
MDQLVLCSASTLPERTQLGISERDALRVSLFAPMNQDLRNFVMHQLAIGRSYQCTRGTISSYPEHNYLGSSPDTRSVPLSLSIIISQTGGKLALDADPISATQKTHYIHPISCATSCTYTYVNVRLDARARRPVIASMISMFKDGVCLDRRPAPMVPVNDIYVCRGFNVNTKLQRMNDALARMTI